MTTDRLAAARDQYRLLLERRHAALDPLLRYVAEGHGHYMAGWVHEEVCARLEQFSRDVALCRSPRLILCLPPRHGKTEIVGRRWPVWHLGHNPRHEVVYATYGQDLANKVSRRARHACEMTARDLEYMAPGETWGVEYWETTGGGSYNAVGVGGPLTGQGAHVLILDDLVKNSEKAASAAVRESTWEWYQTTAYTRLAPGGGVLLMATRWHEDDPIGRAIAAQAEGGDQWEVISYPAIAEEDERHRRRGEALHPDRYDLADLEGKRAVLGSRAFAALYQQRPSPATGGMFQREWLTRDATTYRERPVFLTEQAISVDCTFKDTSTSDYVVMQVWGRHGARKYLLDQVRGRMDYPATRHALVALAAKWPRAVLKIVEDRANGSALIADLRAHVPGLVPYDPKASKEARASIAAAQFEAGDVWLPHPSVAPWVGDYIEELCSFPAGAHDDQVDATSQILIRWTQHVPTVQRTTLRGTPA